MNEIGKPVDKKCKSCRYASSYSGHYRDVSAYVQCEVYSRKKEAGTKGCRNWKERATKTEH